MAQPLIDRVLTDARTLASGGNRLRAAHAAAAVGDDRFCAVGALINSAFRITGNHEQAHRLGWKVAGMIAKAARLRPVDEDDAGWSLALLSDARGQAAVLRAVDALMVQRVD